MATSPEIIPEEVDFSDWNLPTPEYHWFLHLFLAFTIIFLFRFVRALGIVSVLHHWLVFLSTIATSKGRALRAQRFRLASELTELRAKLNTLNMIDQFVQYSRCERRIKSLERQLSETRPETFSGSIFRNVGISVLLYVMEGILIALLLSRTPSETLSKRSLEVAELGESPFLPLLYGLYHFPSKLLMVLWIGLCHSAAKPITNWLKSRFDSSDQSERGFLEQDANF